MICIKVKIYSYHTELHEIILKYSHFSESLPENIFVGISSFTEKSSFIYYIYYDTIIVFTDFFFCEY